MLLNPTIMAGKTLALIPGGGGGGGGGARCSAQCDFFLGLSSFDMYLLKTFSFILN